MPKQIIILEKTTGPGGDQHIHACLWFAVAGGREIPKPGFQSAFPRALPVELQVLRSGAVIEEEISLQYQPAVTLAQVQSDLQSRYTSRQSEVNAAVNFNLWYSSSWDGASWTNQSLGRPVSQIEGPRSVIGIFRASTALIAGAASIQNLLSIENPVASTVKVIVQQIFAQGVVGVIAATKFLYRIGRTTTLPSAGTVLTSQKVKTAYPAAQGIIRQAPTATAAAGDLRTGTPGVMASAAGAFVPGVGLQAFAEETEVVLDPGEGLVVRAEINTTGWSHVINIRWEEAI